MEGEGQKVGRHEYGHRRSKEPDEAQNGPHRPPKVAVLRSEQQPRQGHRQHQGLGAPLHQQDHLPRHDGGGGPIRPLREQSLGHRGQGAVLDPLAQCPGGQEHVRLHLGQPPPYLLQQGFAAHAAQIAEGQLHVVFAPRGPKLAHEIRPPKDPAEQRHADAQILVESLRGADDRALVLGRVHSPAGISPGVQEHRPSLPLQEHRRAPLQDGRFHLGPAVRLLRLLKGEDPLQGVVDQPLSLFRQGALHGPLEDEVADLGPVGHAVQKHGQSRDLPTEAEGTLDQVRIHLREESGRKPPPALLQMGVDPPLVRHLRGRGPLPPMKKGRGASLRFQELESSVRFVKAQ